MPAYVPEPVEPGGIRNSAGAREWRRKKKACRITSFAPGGKADRGQDRAGPIKGDNGSIGTRRIAAWPDSQRVTQQGSGRIVSPSFEPVVSQARVPAFRWGLTAVARRRRRQALTTLCASPTPSAAGTVRSCAYPLWHPVSTTFPVLIQCCRPINQCFHQPSPAVSASPQDPAVPCRVATSRQCLKPRAKESRGRLCMCRGRRRANRVGEGRRRRGTIPEQPWLDPVQGLHH